MRVKQRTVFSCLFFLLLILLMIPGRGEDVFSQKTSLSSDPDFSLEVLSVRYEGNKRPPRIYIYHTHTYEAYSMDDGKVYESTETWRTKDETRNIAAVGKALADSLSKAGFEVYHDTTPYEPPRLSSSYSRSLEGLEKTLQNPYDLYLDLHRDSFCRGNGPNIVVKGDKEYARILILVGKGTGQTFSDDRPDWKANEKIGLYLSDILNQRCENLCRGVSLKSGRYNQHIAPCCLLIEVGNNKNTLTQALNTVFPLTEAICSYFDRTD